jgi:hypothetical protein
MVIVQLNGYPESPTVIAPGDTGDDPIIIDWLYLRKLLYVNKRRFEEERDGLLVLLIGAIEALQEDLRALEGIRRELEAIE